MNVKPNVILVNQLIVHIVGRTWSVLDRVNHPTRVFVSCHQLNVNACVCVCVCVCVYTREWMCTWMTRLAGVKPSVQQRHVQTSFLGLPVSNCNFSTQVGKTVVFVSFGPPQGSIGLCWKRPNVSVLLGTRACAFVSVLPAVKVHCAVMCTWFLCHEMNCLCIMQLVQLVIVCQPGHLEWSFCWFDRL